MSFVNATDSSTRPTAAAEAAIERGAEACRPSFDRWAAQADEALQRSADTVRDTTRQLRDQALKATSTTAERVRQQPLSSVLIAAAVGAAAMALVGLFTHRDAK